MKEVSPRRVEQQIRNFQKALHAYAAKEPLARFLTAFFKENRQMGASDRRMTTRFCYNYFRLGKALPGATESERLLIAEFLCETDSDLVRLYKPEWARLMVASLSEKLDFLASENVKVDTDIFPFSSHLSQGIDSLRFSTSHLIQPDLFIRVNSTGRSVVSQELDRAGIVYEDLGNGSLRLSNGSKLQEVRSIHGLYEVQDLSSQQSLDVAIVNGGEEWWDACAASGGKSLLLIDRRPDIRLLVSDIRLSILRNLDERFEKSKVKIPYQKKVLDLSQDVSHLMAGRQFDGIVLDAPCSGSGTWGRTPEMIQQFQVGKIREYAQLQRKIASNVLPYLKPNGQLIYITCSVFSEENEGMLSFLEKEHGLQVEQTNLFTGYEYKADSMFAARLRKKV
ncbi:16S rRNA (cytosine967-C5)-methyltransferase [Sphingobacterium allocomposti]|uniref:16S rRNA (Cytosine967-C5)-methyltransferase n=1 Tax=Sphingobacterium allocomposti TaxID=415956 RepID=A0A5S5DLM7_9SPHI|nr:RsmB/NOP family class I SAM-dependent RNA methyltransferase [Sphingobacterium composti Yoo et al. 2007 non Ten et al. 2007]TYP95712.1 16S rRNA (cytosine967-C5)-methyltransferase [Sphingobacterium composti Yoo et al. 2007 non Ten et al. 2007]